MYKNKYDHSGFKSYESPTGSKIRVKRGWIYEDGELVFKEKGLTNVYEEIQAAKDSVDLHAIMQRYEDGDASALQQVQGMYIDAVDLPKSYAEIYDAVSKANIVFDSMPQEIKAKYDNNPAKFWRNYGTETFDDLINAYRKETFARYGIEDTEPVVTADTIKPIKKDTDPVVKEVNNEQKSE